VREGGSRVIFGVDLPSPAMQPRNDTVVGAHFGRASQRSEMDSQTVSQLLQRTEMGKGE
jgi:hypothetical protein